MQPNTSNAKREPWFTFSIPGAGCGARFPEFLRYNVVACVSESTKPHMACVFCNSSSPCQSLSFRCLHATTRATCLSPHKHPIPTFHHYATKIISPTRHADNSHLFTATHAHDDQFTSHQLPCFIPIIHKLPSLYDPRTTLYASLFTCSPLLHHQARPQKSDASCWRLLSASGVGWHRWRQGHRGRGSCMGHAVCRRVYAYPSISLHGGICYVCVEHGSARGQGAQHN